MTSLANSNWGVENGILRATQSALLGNLTRFGLVAAGSGTHAKDPQRLETRHANVAVRNVLGVHATAILETLLSTADLLTVRNLVPRSCAAMQDRGLRASDGSIAKRLDGWTTRAYGVSPWDSRPA